MKNTTININMDKKCSRCGDAGAMDHGKCIKCVADDVIAAKTPTRREMRKVKITSLKSKGAYMEWVDTGNGESDTSTKESTREMHADLYNAFQRLCVHMVLLCELKDPILCSGVDMENVPEDVAYAMELDKYRVCSIALGGSDEHSGVTISGRRNLKNNRVLNLNTPFTKFFDENEPYLFERDLARCVDHVIAEAEQYLQGKYAPSPQTEMEFPASEPIDA